MPALKLRPAQDDEAAAAAGVWLASRWANTATIPAPVHSDDAVRRWMCETVFTTREVWLAVDADDTAIGLLVLDEAWLDDLYVVPERSGHGVGVALLELAKRLRPDGFGLWVFASNTGAQRFYQRHGLLPVERTDGAGNEEKAHDIRYLWSEASCP
jgi:GNAT superfamily N-acetyltransferase